MENIHLLIGKSTRKDINVPCSRAKVLVQSQSDYEEIEANVHRHSTVNTSTLTVYSKQNTRNKEDPNKGFTAQVQSQSVNVDH